MQHFYGHVDISTLDSELFLTRIENQWSASHQRILHVSLNSSRKQHFLGGRVMQLRATTEGYFWPYQYIFLVFLFQRTREMASASFHSCSPCLTPTKNVPEWECIFACIHWKQMKNHFSLSKEEMSHQTYFLIPPLPFSRSPNTCCVQTVQKLFSPMLHLTLFPVYNTDTFSKCYSITILFKEASEDGAV